MWHPKFSQFLVSFMSTYPENVINSDQILNNFKLLAACLEGNPLTRHSYFKRILDGTNIYNHQSLTFLSLTVGD